MGHAQSSVDDVDLWLLDTADFGAPPKQDPPAEKRSCKVCKIPKERHGFPSKTQFKTTGHCTACTCSYCGCGGKMTREHLLPRCVGGTAIIAACAACNSERGRSGRYSPFVRYIEKHPHTWAAAVLTSTREPAEINEYLSEEDLHSATFLALHHGFAPGAKFSALPHAGMR